MAVLFTANDYSRAGLATKIKGYLPDLDIRVWPDVGSRDEITYVIATGTAPTEHFQDLPNLKAIFLSAAGVDAIIHDPGLPNVPIVRCVNESLSAGMAEYVVYHALKYHRNFHVYDRQQTEHLWKQQRFIPTHDRTVGIMGVGAMGIACLNALRPFGFQLRGWSRTTKQIDGVTSFAAMEQLPDFFSGCDIVVCVLPLTNETRGILCANNLRHMPQGSYLINAGRGDHMVEDDMITLLDNDHLAGIALDVFHAEPLPTDNLLWSHPKVIITPHIASITDFKALCQDIQKQIADFEKGVILQNVVDRKLGY